MAKKLYAVTNVNMGLGRFYPAGSEIDKKDFADDRDTLAQLADAGAVEVREESEDVVTEPENAPVANFEGTSTEAEAEAQTTPVQESGVEPAVEAENANNEEDANKEEDANPSE